MNIQEMFYMKLLKNMIQNQSKINQFFKRKNKRICIILFLFLSQNQRIIFDQQKLVQNLQLELSRLQKRLAKIESEGIVEPSIMFTRLDIERNEQTLQQALSRGKLPETVYNVCLKFIYIS